MKNLVLFASGNGSNAVNIIRYFHEHDILKVVAVFTNNPEAYVIQRAAAFQIPLFVFTANSLKNDKEVLNKLREFHADVIILAGFLLKIPEYIIDAFPDRIINIHPALLPDYGGKGMYGHFVHEAVVRNKEPKSGITIHYVNSHYDEGAIIFQATCALDLDETPDSLAEKIHVLEQQHFPQIIEKVFCP